ncbi:HNH endonuclease [Pseudomonas asplenii]|uniref:HNH endonuclease n=1 Tax=Pseudomonas asplenii TaxID=53407 RepID=UPI00035F9E2B|nr:HNH endonuclease [Pseudomonas fuscovaginae]
MAKGWSNEELLASLEAYRLMAQKQESGISYSKKQVYEELAARFDRTAKAFEYRMQNISAVFDELGLPWIPGLKPAVNVGSDMKIRLVQLIQGKTPGEGAQAGNVEDSTNWEKALAAVIQLGGIAGRNQIEEWIRAREPGYNANSLSDLYMMSVNARARTGYQQNKKPRRTDQGNRYDRLFKVGKGTFGIYDPAQHGVWEIYPDASSGSRFGVSVRRVTSPIEEALAQAEEDAEHTTGFDPADVADARKRITASIVRRRGQPAFRKALLEAYSGACAITGCNLPDVLEAAHIHPYKGDHTNVISNGLLLRADIHTLFDLGLIAIESETMVVRVAPNLKDTDYGTLDGSLLRRPEQQTHWVSPEALDWHWSQCGWCE